jgi:hypothetical protein
MHMLLECVLLPVPVTTSVQDQHNNAQPTRLVNTAVCQHHKAQLRRQNYNTQYRTCAHASTTGQEKGGAHLAE